MFDDDLDDLRAESAAERAYMRAYLAHPNPADPDYPEPLETEGDDE
jgi:hypothetical protein